MPNSRTYEEQDKKRKVDETHINMYNGKKENKIFLIYKEIQKGAVAKSYMTNGLLIYD